MSRQESKQSQMVRNIENPPKGTKRRARVKPLPFGVFLLLFDCFAHVFWLFRFLFWLLLHVFEEFLDLVYWRSLTAWCRRPKTSGRLGTPSPPAPGRLGETTGGLRSLTRTFAGHQPASDQTYSDVKPTVRKPLTKSTIREGQTLGLISKKLISWIASKFGQLAPYFRDQKLCVLGWFLLGFGSVSAH